MEIRFEEGFELIGFAMRISLGLKIIGVLLLCFISGFVSGLPANSLWNNRLSYSPNSGQVSFFSEQNTNGSHSTSFFISVAAPAVAKTSKANGNWNDPDIWDPTGVPAAGDDVSIAHNVTVDNNFTCNNIDIQAGGTLNISGTNKLTVTGNWENNGIFTANSSTLIFEGTANVEIRGSSMTSFYDLTFNKTGGLATTVEFKAAQTVSCTHTLLMTSGLLKLTSGTVTLDCNNFEIAKPSGIWIDGATLNNKFSITNKGLIKVSSGTANFGTISGNYVHTQFDGAFQVAGGNVFIAGRLRNSAGGTLATGIPSGITITGGNVTLCTVGNALIDEGSLQITQNGAFNFTGGTIIFQNGSTATTALDIGLVDGTGNGAKTTIGGTFQMGNSLTPANTTFKINSEISLYNLTINNASGNNPSIQIGRAHV